MIKISPDWFLLVGKAGIVWEESIKLPLPEGDLTDKIFIKKVVKPCPAGNGGFIDSSHTISCFSYK